MNTQKTKGDILAERIEAIKHDFDGLQGLSEILGEALADYRRPLLAVPVLTPEQIAAGWVEWHGGECPVWGGSKPTVMFPGGDTASILPAKGYRWAHAGTKTDIIAYRPDPYESLKKAHAEGKVIQVFIEAEDRWRDCQSGCAALNFIYLPEYYRVKPAPVMVPLGPEDVKCGDMIRNPNMMPHVLALGITEICNQGVNCGGNGRYRTFLVMFLDGDEISRDGGKTWERCEKEAK